MEKPYLKTLRIVSKSFRVKSFLFLLKIVLFVWWVGELIDSLVCKWVLIETSYLTMS